MNANETACPAYFAGNLHESKMIHQDLSNKIIKAFYNVYNILGFGFLEKVYENALKFELQRMGYKVEQ
jgi:hypothetical protein